VWQHGGIREDRRPGKAQREIQQLTRQPQTGAERGGAEQHDHRLHRKRDRRERQRHADLRRRGRERGDENDRADPFGGAERASVSARGERREQCL
jgi:hypothetical protein